MLGMPEVKVKCEVCQMTGNHSAVSRERALESLEEAGWTIVRPSEEGQPIRAYCRHHRPTSH
jgi:hypothetical protein